MTKEELFEVADNVLYENKIIRLNKCQAWYAVDNIPCTSDLVIALRSYNTPVAIFSSANNALYVRNYYSHTTVQHINTFLKYLHATGYTFINVIYLYRRTDAIIAARFIEKRTDRYTYLSRTDISRRTLNEYQKLEQQDFESIITLTDQIY